MKFAAFLLYAVHHSSRRLLIVSQALKISQGDIFVARILVVDDDKAVRLLLRAMLERRGHSVVEAENGDEGLRYYRAAPTDLVITDIQMPVMDGLQMIKELRALFPQPRSLLSRAKRAGSLRPRHSASARLRSHCIWRNSWTPCSSAPLHLGLYLYDAAQYSCCGPQRPRGRVSHRAWPRSFIRKHDLARQHWTLYDLDQSQACAAAWPDQHLDAFLTTMHSILEDQRPQGWRRQRTWPLAQMSPPLYHFDKADMILSLDADFLACKPGAACCPLDSISVQTQVPAVGHDLTP